MLFAQLIEISYYFSCLYRASYCCDPKRRYDHEFMMEMRQEGIIVKNFKQKLSD